MNAMKAIQLSGSRIAKVPYGGRKRKLKLRIPPSAAATAGPEPQVRAATRMIKRKASATVVGLMWGPSNFSAPVTAAMLKIATAKPNHLDLIGERDSIPCSVRTGSGSDRINGRRRI